MLVEDFDFYLPEELIAQDPLAKRDASRLMVLNRSDKSIAHMTFDKVLNYLNPGDVLVLNNTKVIPAIKILRNIVIHGKIQFQLL